MIWGIVFIGVFSMFFLSFKKTDFIEYEKPYKRDEDNLDPTEIFQSEKKRNRNAE